MIVDYEAAWIAFTDYVRGKPHHGRAALLEEMARLLAEHRVPERDPALTLRLFSVEMSRRYPPTTRIDADPSGADSLRAGTSESTTTMTAGGHDGSSTAGDPADR